MTLYPESRAGGHGQGMKAQTEARRVEGSEGSEQGLHLRSAVAPSPGGREGVARRVCSQMQGGLEQGRVPVTTKFKPLG